MDYLLKPLDPERLRQALARARRRRIVHTPRAGDGPTTPRASDAIFVAGRGGGLWLDQSLIVWVEAVRDHALLHTEERGHMLQPLQCLAPGADRLTIESLAPPARSMRWRCARVRCILTA